MPVVTHPIKQYYSETRTREMEISRQFKVRLLKLTIRDLMRKGRVCLNANFDQWHDALNGLTTFYWSFRTVYVGRKGILRKGLRHDARKKYKEFLCQPIQIPR